MMQDISRALIQAGGLCIIIGLLDELLWRTVAVNTLFHKRLRDYLEEQQLNRPEVMIHFYLKPASSLQEPQYYASSRVAELQSDKRFSDFNPIVLAATPYDPRDMHINVYI